MVELLQEEGHDAGFAGSVAEAMAAFRRGPQGLLIVDPALRDGGGRDFLDLAKTLGVPTVVTTSDPAFDPERTRYDGLAGFLYKPIEMRTLLAVIASILEPGRPA